MTHCPRRGDMVRLSWIDLHSFLFRPDQPAAAQLGQTFVVLEAEDLSGAYLLTCLQCDNSQRHYLFHHEVETIARRES